MTLSIKSIGGTINEIPTVIGLRELDKTADSITIQYTVKDIELTICRHYLTVKTSTGTVINKKEITKEVGYERSNDLFTYKIPNLDRNTAYTIQIFASDGHDESKSDAISVTTKNYLIYGIRVDESNSNPETSVTYIDEATGMTPAKGSNLGSWENTPYFKKIRLVGFKNGQVTKEIQKNNKTLYTDGMSVPSDVDVMLELPRLYWKFTKISHGYELRITEKKLDGYVCLAHLDGTVEKEKLYIGCYLASYGSDGKMRSVPGKDVFTRISLNNFLDYLRANGTGYQPWSYYSYLILQILYLIFYKNRDGQTALGMGYVGQPSVSTVFAKTGGTKNKTFCYANGAHEQMCFLGIEDFWGNYYQIVEGICTKNNIFYFSKDNKNFNKTGSGYVKNENVYLAGTYYGQATADNVGAFLPVKNATYRGSETTGYCDWSSSNSDLYENGTLRLGGVAHWPYGSGPFCAWNESRVESLLVGLGYRICYL